MRVHVQNNTVGTNVWTPVVQKENNSLFSGKVFIDKPKLSLASILLTTRPKKYKSLSPITAL